MAKTCPTNGVNRTVFSGLTVAGFWFVLVFISATVYCIYLATEVRKYPTLSHDDLLRALAESRLSVSTQHSPFSTQHSSRMKHP